MKICAGFRGNWNGKREGDKKEWKAQYYVSKVTDVYERIEEKRREREKQGVRSHGPLSYCGIGSISDKWVADT